MSESTALAASPDATAVAADHGSVGHDEHAGHHVVSMKTLFGVFGALVTLTALTYGASELAPQLRDLHLGWANIWIAMVIAGVKATLVLAIFMHLRWDKPFNSLVIGISLLFVILFIGVSMVDTAWYEDTVDPNFGRSSTNPDGS